MTSTGPPDVGDAGLSGRWVLLAYRLPREPSRPRIAVWRKLERLGVARLGDGLVALPTDARTREHLDWLADEISEYGGTATVWLASPSTAGQERHIAATMRAARAAEYQTVITEAGVAASAGEVERARVVRRLRGELRRIARRDFFPPPERDRARTAVQALADTVAPVDREPEQERA
ncbi:Chromate resistance protein ChrB [Micromonospora foliorum]|uniref:Chromate resistance protein ChrB n=1 Tax=Micromonospora foliorum TaxID=2911210 RepID=UPI001EE92696|nr:Chromate resistance protein ChrB [Micromonospora foliorum]MCG5436444.1 chromate resistance protein [Micromonospora foliorum]